MKKAATGWGDTYGQADWAGRGSEAQWGRESGRSGRKEEVGHGWAESEENSFLNKI
jgi:hypothetical protein